MRWQAPLPHHLDFRPASGHCRLPSPAAARILTPHRVGISLSCRRYHRWLAAAAALVLATGAQRCRAEDSAQGAQGDQRHIHPRQPRRIRPTLPEAFVRRNRGAGRGRAYNRGWPPPARTARRPFRRGRPVRPVARASRRRAAQLRLASEPMAERGSCAPWLSLLVARPIGKAKARTNRVQPSVQMQDEVVQLVAEKREPPGALDDPVEKVAVQYEQAAAIRGYMHDLFPHLDSSERKLQEVSAESVVVAWDEYDASPLARLAQNLLHDIVVHLGPVPAPPQLPAIDDIADKIKIFRLGGA